MKRKGESGEVVVEASIVVTLVLIVITIMLYVGMILYQQTLVSVMANQTAANIAQVYSNNLKDPFSGYVDPDSVYQSITYSNMKTDAYMTVVEQKANVFAQYRLKSSRILANGNTSVDVQVVKKPNELLKSQIVVTVRDRYDVPLVGIFGTSGLVEFASSGRADCVDVLEYINGVEAIGDPEESNVSFLPDAKSCTVTFIPDPDNLGDFTIETVLKGHSIMSSNRYTHCVMPADPEKGELEFAGWFTADGNAFTGTSQIDENITVYGRWKCEVILVANGSGATVNGKETDTVKVVYGNRTVFPVPYRAGYSFAGWFDAENNQYNSNDTSIIKNVSLKAKWNCAHPSRREERTGTICNGGTIKYKCNQCDAELGTGTYSGVGHDYWYKCSKRHEANYFDGCTDGGCWGYHQRYTWCSACNCTHGKKVYYYHVVCAYCGIKNGNLWCGNTNEEGTTHCKYTVYKRPQHPC